MKKSMIIASTILLSIAANMAYAGKPPITGAATNVTNDSAALGATFSSKDGYFATVSWGPKSGRGYIANCGPLPNNGAQSCTASQLQCGTTYRYHALQMKANDQVIAGKEMHFTTAACK